MADATPTTRELEALKVLWSKGQATVREVYQAMNANGETLAYTTVLSLLQVMEQKKMVRHDKRGKAYIYVPLLERTKTFRQLAQGFLESVFDGSVNEYLVHALESKRITADELDQLDSMIEAARKKGQERE